MNGLGMVSAAAEAMTTPAEAVQAKLPGALLILGPEGAGLTLVTMVAGLLGLDLPRDARAGGTVDSPDSWVSAAVAGALAGDGTPPLVALHAGYGPAACPVVRAPGLDRALPSWVEALASVEREPAALIVLSAPVTPLSVEAWEGWAADLLQVERATRRMRRYVIRLEALLANWRGELSQAAQALGIEWPAWTEGQAAVDACIAAAPRRPAPSPAAAGIGGRLAGEAVAMVDRMMRLETDAETLRRERDRAASVLHDRAAAAEDDARARAAAEAAAAELRTALDRAERDLAVLRAERIEAVRERLAALLAAPAPGVLEQAEASRRAEAEAQAAEAAARAEASAARAAEAAAQDAEAAARAEARAARAAEAEARAAEAAARAEARAARAAEAAARSRQAEAERQLAEIRASRSWRLTAPVRTVLDRMRRS